MTVAILGTFDVPNYGDLLFPLLARRRFELLGQDLLVVSPVGGRPFVDALPSVGVDEFLASRPSLRAIVLGGGNIVHAGSGQDVYTRRTPPRIAAYPELWLAAEASSARSGAPLVWNAPGLPAPFGPAAAELLRRVVDHSAYVAVRDDGSLAHLEATGPATRAHVVPDPAFEVARLFARDELDETFRLLASMKGRSPGGRFVALHVSPHRTPEPPELLARAFDALAKRLRAVPLLLSIGPCHDDGALLRRTAQAMRSRPMVLDAPYRLAEIAACLAHSVAYFGASMHGAITALAHGVPFLLVAHGADHKLADLTTRLGCPDRLVQGWEAALRRLDHGVLELPTAVLERRDELVQRLDIHWQHLLAAVRSTPRRVRRLPGGHAARVLPAALLEELLAGALQVPSSPEADGPADERSPTPPVAHPLPRPVGESVTVVVAVHDAYAAVARCLPALLSRTLHPHRILLVDDASRDERVARLLRETAAAHDHVELVVNPSCVGYTASVQAACFRDRHDVVLLNSDTEVTTGWLGRLAAMARSEASVATVTPLSNAAGAFSVPFAHRDNALPSGLDAEAMAAMVARVSPRLAPRAPTGNGFCMYVTRAALDATGGFDVQNFPGGYGEENDFCMRASAAGFVHLIDDATFIYHQRGASFGDRRAELFAAHQETLRELHPSYERAVGTWMADEPLAPVRAALRRELGLLGAPILFVLHEGGGGVQETTGDLLHVVQREHPCVVLIMGGEEWTVLDAVGSHRTRLRFGTPWRLARAPDPARVEALRGICRAHGIRLAHVRHLHGGAPELMDVFGELGIPVVFSVHDYYAVCPTVKLRDEHGVFCAGRCTPGAGDCPIEGSAASTYPYLKHRYVVDWRRRMAGALLKCRALVTTSLQARQLMVDRFPRLADADWVHIEHGRNLSRYVDCGTPPPQDKRVSVLFLGVLNEAKGARLLEAFCEQNLRHGEPYQLHLLGAVGDFPWQRLGALWHGAYRREELPALLAGIRPSFCLLPSQWAETWCHTLTEAWAAGIPVLASDLGALKERIELEGGGWLVDPGDGQAWFQTLQWIVNCPGEHARKRGEIQAMQFSSREGMGQQYLALYARLLVSTPRRAGGYSPSTELHVSLAAGTTRMPRRGSDDTPNSDWGALESRYSVAMMRTERCEGVVGQAWLSAWREAPQVEWS